MPNQLEESLFAALRTAGLRPKAQWITQAISRLSASSEQFQRGSVQQKVDMMMEMFLVTDIRASNDGTLPQDIRMWHKKKLEGNHVVQLDELVNVAVPIKARYQTTSERCLKLKISDGVTDTIAVEYHQIPTLGWDTSPGSKMVITDALVVNGALFLAPQNVQMLGGQVTCLAAAHEAAATVCNRPAKPYQREGDEGSAVSQSLIDRAAHAASSAYLRSRQNLFPALQTPQLHGQASSSTPNLPSIQVENHRQARDAHSQMPTRDAGNNYVSHQNIRPAWKNHTPAQMHQGQPTTQSVFPSKSATGMVPEVNPSGNRGVLGGQISGGLKRPLSLEKSPATPYIPGNQSALQSTGRRRLKRLYSQVDASTDTHISEKELEDDIEDKMLEEFTDLMSPPPNRKPKTFSPQQSIIDLCDSPNSLGLLRSGQQGPRGSTRFQSARELFDLQQGKVEEKRLGQNRESKPAEMNLEEDLDEFMIDLSAVE